MPLYHSVKKLVLILVFFPSCTIKLKRLLFVTGFRTRPSRLQHPTFAASSTTSNNYIRANDSIRINSNNHDNNNNINANFCSKIWSTQQQEQQWHRCMKMSSGRSFSMRRSNDALIELVSSNFMNDGEQQQQQEEEEQFLLKTSTSATSSSSFVRTATVPRTSSSTRQRHRLLASKSLRSSTSVYAHDNDDDIDSSNTYADTSSVDDSSSNKTADKKGVRKRITSWARRVVTAPWGVISRRRSNRNKIEHQDDDVVESFDTTTATDSSAFIANGATESSTTAIDDSAVTVKVEENVAASIEDGPKLTTTTMEAEPAKIQEEEEEQQEELEQEHKVNIHRSAISSPNVDLSGQWKLIVTDEFKKEYDTYLKHLGQPSLVRSIALSIIGMTTEETKQSDDGKSLWIRGTNVRGVWERTLIASDEANPVLAPIVTADSEEVDSESWWENSGTVHHSWMRGITKYGGGDFESIRYLDGEEDVLVCESVFHPTDKNNKKEEAKVTWRFAREATSAAS